MKKTELVVAPFKKTTKKENTKKIWTILGEYQPWRTYSQIEPFVIDRAQLGKAYQNAGVLFEVLLAVTKSEKGEEVAPEVWTF
jgi:callose synthase